MENLKYPNNEIVWMSYVQDDQVLFIITSKGMLRDSYYLYENQNGTFKKLFKGDDPPQLEEKYWKAKEKESK